MWPLKKKEPVKQWSDFRIVNNCNECGHLGFGGAFNYCCPECGMDNYGAVSARFEFYERSAGLMVEIVKTGNYEVKK